LTTPKYNKYIFSRKDAEFAKKVEIHFFKTWRSLRLGEKSVFVFSRAAVIRPHLCALVIAGNKIQSAGMS
jgi:hypothetical protein